MDTLQSVEEFLVLKEPILISDPLNPSNLEDLTDGQLAFLDADCYNVLSSLANKNKVFIAMRYSEDDVRITEWQIKNTKSMTYHTARPNHCAIKSFMVPDTTLGAEDYAATSDSAAGNILLNDYFVRLHITNPLAEETLAYNETIMVPAGTRLHKLTTGLNIADHKVNVQATVLIGFMKQLIQRSKNLDASFKPYLCDIRNPNLGAIDAIGTEFKTANLWDESDPNYGLIFGDINDYAIVLVGGYEDISLSVYGIHNKSYRKRRMYNVNITAEDYQYSFGHVTFTVPPTFTREPQEAIGAGVDLQRVELFDSGNFDKWGTPNYVSTIDGEPFDFNFKTDHQKSYIQYIIEAFNEDINGESRMYRHPVQWRLLVETGVDAASICNSFETMLDTVQGVDLMFRSTEITPRNEDVVNVRTLSVLPEIKISRTNIESITYDRTEQFAGDSINFSVVFATGYPDLKTLTFNGVNISSYTGAGTRLNPLLFSVTIVDGDNKLIIEAGKSATILNSTIDVNVSSVTSNPSANLFVGDSVQFTIAVAQGYFVDSIKFNNLEVINDFNRTTGKLDVVLTLGPNQDGENEILVTAGNGATIFDRTTDVNVMSVTPNPNANLLVGDSVEFTITVAQGYKANSIMFNNVEVINDLDRITGKLDVILTLGPNQDGDNEIIVTADNSATILDSTTDVNIFSVTPNPATNLLVGDSVEFYIAAAPRYYVDSIKFNNVEVINDFDPITGKLDVILTMGPNKDGENEIVVEAGNIATIIDSTTDVNVMSVTPNPATNLLVGDTVQFTITFASGYQADSIMFNNVEVINNFDPITGKLNVVLTSGLNVDGENKILVEAKPLP